MSTTKKQPARVAHVTVRNCTITNSSAANEHTRAAVEALSAAAKANAEAINAIANALKGSPATIEHGIHLSNL